MYFTLDQIQAAIEITGVYHDAVATVEREQRLAQEEAEAEEAEEEDDENHAWQGVSHPGSTGFRDLFDALFG